MSRETLTALAWLLRWPLGAVLALCASPIVLAVAVIDPGAARHIFVDLFGWMAQPPTVKRPANLPAGGTPANAPIPGERIVQLYGRKGRHGGPG